MTSRSLPLRPYQDEALTAIRTAWDSGIVRTSVVLPTGMGKTVVFATLAADWVRKMSRQGGRNQVLILVHRDELAQQTVTKIHSVDPTLTVGIVKAERNEITAQIVVASVQTLRSPKRMTQLRNVGMIIVDEAHHAAARSYVEILKHFGAWERFDGTTTPTVGFTATMSRTDNKSLGEVWENVCYERDIFYGISRGYLSDVRGKRVTVEALDLNDVPKSHGDYQDTRLGEALIASGASKIAAEAYVEHANDRQGVVFAPSVEAATVFCDDFNAAGIKTEMIAGATPIPERQAIYTRFETGQTQALANCMVLTEGWDAPHASCAVIARPTTSQGLYVQMVGRVLRPHHTKTDALVLDIVGVATRLQLASVTDLTEHQVIVRDTESITEAYERAEREQADYERPEGDLVAVEIDLFDKSTSMWLRTNAGIWFIPTKATTWFIFPEPSGTWMVARRPSRGVAKPKPVLSGLAIDYAMVWAEQYAAEEDPSISSKTSSWRQRSRPPTEKQISLLNRLGVSEAAGNMPKGANDASNLISTMLASQQLDSYLPKGTS